MKSKKQLSNLNKKVQSKKRNKNLTGGAGEPIKDMEGKYLFLDVDKTLVNKNVCHYRSESIKQDLSYYEKQEDYKKLIELLTEFKARGGKAHIITRCIKEINMIGETNEKGETSYHTYFEAIVEQLNKDGGKDSVISADSIDPTNDDSNLSTKTSNVSTGGTVWAFAKSIVMYYLFRNLVLNGENLELANFILIDDDMGNGQVAADFGFTNYTTGKSVGLKMTNNALKTILNQGSKRPKYTPVDETQFSQKEQRVFDTVLREFKFESIEDLETLILFVNKFAKKAQEKIPYPPPPVYRGKKTPPPPPVV